MTSVRRVRRIVRKIDPWTVLKVSFVFHAVMALGIVLGLVILWSVINRANIPGQIFDVFEQIGIFEEGTQQRLDGEQFFRVTVFLAVVWTVLMTGVTTLAAVVYNLISDVVGGIEVVVLEESLAVAPVTQPVRPPQSWRADEGQQAPARTPAPEPSLVDMPTQETSTVSR